MNSFDIDGVIFMGDNITGVFPGPDDIIITGRSFEEQEYTLKMLRDRGIKNGVFFNPLLFNEKTRESSGQHKADCLRRLLDSGFKLNIHFEDDPIQAKIIEEQVKEITVVLLVHNLVEKENVWHGN